MGVRVVLDTSVLVAGLRSHGGASNLLLRFVAERKITILATPPLFLEYEDVLMRAEHRLVHGLSVNPVADFLSELAALIEPVEIHFRWRPQLADPNDEMVLEAALNGRAQALVTHNIRHFQSAATRFQIEILEPQDVIRRIRS